MCSLLTLLSGAQKCACVRMIQVRSDFVTFWCLMKSFSLFTNALDWVYPTWQYSSAHTMVWWQVLIRIPIPAWVRAMDRNVEKCLILPSPKESSSLDLHQQERSNQADSISIDDVCTVNSHNENIITSSNAPAGEQVKVAENNYFCPCLQVCSLACDCYRRLLDRSTIDRS